MTLAEKIAALAALLRDVEVAATAEDSRVRELEALCERLRLEAEIWAQEARTQKHTVHECYQAVTGATGEPGDWNGARPVVERIRELEAENARLREALQRTRPSPNLNPSAAP